MKLFVAVMLGIVFQSTRASELTELRDRAATIREQVSEEEIPAELARRRVERVVRDFERWSETHEVDLELRSRTHASSVDADEPLSVNQCDLFFEDDARELCLLDLMRTEIWGATVLFCRYLCE